MPVPGPRSVLCLSPVAVVGSVADITPPLPSLVMSREQPVPAKPRIGRQHIASNSTLLPRSSKRTDLQGGFLAYSDLAGADLRGANLQLGDIAVANLRGA